MLILFLRVIRYPIFELLVILKLIVIIMEGNDCNLMLKKNFKLVSIFHCFITDGLGKLNEVGTIMIE